MKDNSMLVNSNVKKNKSQLRRLGHVIPNNRSSFENLGFKFKSNEDVLYVTLPEGWTIQDSNDGFTVALIDENGSDRGKIEFGNFPLRDGSMWLYEDVE